VLEGLTLDVDELLAATAEEPGQVGHVGLDSMLAACVDHVMELRGLQPPDWTSGLFRSMSDAWLVEDVPSAELRRLRETPEAFRAHGIELVWS
jgi:hypothetical protein